MKPYDIVALGEILIDYTPLPTSSAGMAVFEQNAGGAPANVLACAAKFSSKTAFVGKIGDDMQGAFLRKTLMDANIDTRGLCADPSFFTTLAFVSLSETGERSFSFARKHSADINLRKEDIDTDLLRDSKIFHFGSLSLTDPICKEATLFALHYAKEQGAIISYDPNYRALLWADVQTATAEMRSVLPFVDILKISEEETVLMTGEQDPYKAMDVLLAQNIAVVAITLGENGALIGTAQGVIAVHGYHAEKVTDTTGAGDAFWGAMLHQVAAENCSLKALSLSQLVSFVAFANVTASLCVEERGAIRAMPSLAQVQARLAEQK